MPKRKRGVGEDAACRQQAIMKRERRVAATDEERNRQFSTMAKSGQERRNGTKKNSLLTVMVQRGQKRGAKKTEERRNRGLSDMAQRGQERKAEETEEQRSRRLSDMAQRSQERRAEENRRKKEWPIGQTRRVT
ncbi:hypothetical protein AVEN_189342-1 [Araneus ventricosus]|uniref:STPR domain-containing protein n=1 Tax=Araneus ventricosus TaxID=182803 RepID=A0A4Y2FEU5_ARAVE|nr:hypothetical protein AVEN_189341-1 [Araneus ventricosus]GBM38815.1 hypothetical protein AVEN_189342-1 [Araneus ventricosus]